MSKESRDSYFDLARALTKASSSSRLLTPTFPDHKELISKEQIDEYCEYLNIDKSNRESVKFINDWKFGEEDDFPQPAAKFKDFILLQQVSSNLRTKLADDINSRRQPN